MDQLIIDYGTHFITQSRSIHDFVILLAKILNSGHVTIRAKKSIDLITSECS